MIKAVLFDVDGVLLDSFEANLDFFQNLLAQAGYQGPTREQYSTMFHLPMWDVISILTKSPCEEEIKRIWEMGRGRDSFYDHNLLSLGRAAEEVIPSLSSLYQLGIVTGRIRESIYEFAKLKTLEPHFSVAISYEDTANHKPHPEPLLLASQRLNILPQECVYIGDQETDMTAADAAGMKRILYSTTQRSGGIVCATSFSQLHAIISRL